MYSLGPSKVPQYATIRDDLMAKISSGKYPVGHHLPPEDKLTEEYGVSRGTVRRALYDLELAGIISRRAALGTLVESVSPRFEKVAGDIVSMSDLLRRNGMRAESQILDKERLAASAAQGRVVEGFGITPSTPVFYIRRLRYGVRADREVRRDADKTPLSIQSVYLLPRLCPGILDEPDERLQHLFQVYAQRYDRRIVVADEVINVAQATEDEAALLGIEPAGLVFVRDRVSTDQRGEVFEVLHAVDHPQRFVYRYRVASDDIAIRPSEATRHRRQPGEHARRPRQRRAPR